MSKKLFVLNGGAAVKPEGRGAYLHIPDPKSYFSKSGINTGDVLVYDAMLKQLDYDSVSNLQFAHAADAKLWPGDDVAATVVRGSNYLASNVDLGSVVPLLKRLRGPIVPVGVGAQAASYGRLQIPKGSQEAWRVIASKCESIGVRGTYSAEVFNDIGIRNVRVIGCPSFYRGLQPTLALSPAVREHPRFGITLNKYLSADYASSTVKTNRIQRALLARVAQRKGVLYSQGEREESLAVISQGEEKAELLRRIATAFDLQDDAAVLETLGTRMRAFFDVDAWAADVRQSVDVMLGFRLHGNVIALHQGIPAIFFTYDSRIRELAALFQVPSVDIDDFEPIDLDALLDKADFSRFPAAYARNYAAYVRFLDENGLQHRLAPTSVTGAPADFVNKVQQDLSREVLSAWTRAEVDALATSNEALRKRAWSLELKLRELRAAEEARLNAGGDAPQPARTAA